MKKLICLTLVIFVLFIGVGCKPSESKISTYEIKAEYLDNGVIGAHLAFNYVCDIKEGTSVLAFNLFANAFRKDANITPIEGEEKTYGQMEIISVYNGDKKLDFEICGKDENILKVSLPNLVCYGESFLVNVEFGVVLPSGNYRLANGVNTVNVGNWYPTLCVFENGNFYECEYYKVGDPFYQKVANYKIELIVPSTFVVGASGKATSCDVDGGKTKYSYSLEKARDFSFCLSQKYNVLSEESNGVLVNYYYYNDGEPEKTMEITKRALEYFSQKFCSYPYESFSVCQSNFNEGGMEYTGLVYVNDSLNLTNKLYTTVHEIAHQWWYGLVGNNQLIEGYIDEGLTEYSTAIFFDENREFNVDAGLIFKNAKISCQNYKELLSAIGKSPNLKMNKHLSEYEGDLEYVNACYNRPLTMMKTLEDAIGRERVVSTLKGIAEKYKYQIITTQTLLKAFNLHSKLLSSYINGEAVI